MADDAGGDPIDVAQGVYLGGEKYRTSFARATHVVCVLNNAAEVAPAADGVKVFNVDVEDSEDANLLQHLPAALHFISEAVASGGVVLIHCQAGVSRSAAVAVAYLMQARGMGPGAALHLLQRSAPQVQPNDGFMYQLRLFHDMGCCLDDDHPEYKRFCLEQTGKLWYQEGYVEFLDLAPLEEDPAKLKQVTSYRCRKCRKVVATQHNVVPPETATGHAVFRGDRRAVRAGHTVQSAGGRGGEESSIFVEPMRWMYNTIIGGGPHAGKLYCPGCEARLGSYNWAGITNTSGGWVVPAFQLHLARLDVTNAGPLAALAGLRTPKIGPAAQQHQHQQSTTQQPTKFDVGRENKDCTDAAAQATNGNTGKFEAPGARQHVSGPAVGDTLPGDAAIHNTTEQEADLLQRGPPSQLAEDAPIPPPRAAAAAAALNGSHATPDVSSTPSSTAAAAPPRPHCTDRAAPLPSGNSCQDEDNAHCASPDITTAGPAVPAPAPASLAPGGGWFRYLILDCDGVLVDTERPSCESLRRAILRVTGLDIPHSFPQDYYPVMGMTVASCMEYFNQKLNRDWKDIPELAHRVEEVKEVIYAELTSDGIAAFDGAAALIQQAAALQMPTGVGSSGAPAKIRRNLGSSGLAPLLREEHVVSAHEVAAGKPAPDVYLEVMRRLGCAGEPARALVVEDSVHGLQAARAAGAFAVGITNSLPLEHLAPHADLVIGHLDELQLRTLAPAK